MHCFERISCWDTHDLVAMLLKNKIILKSALTYWMQKKFQFLELFSYVNNSHTKCVAFNKYPFCNANCKNIPFSHLRKNIPSMQRIEISICLIHTAKLMFRDSYARFTHSEWQYVCKQNILKIQEHFLVFFLIFANKFYRCAWKIYWIS